MIPAGEGQFYRQVLVAESPPPAARMPVAAHGRRADAAGSREGGQAADGHGSGVHDRAAEFSVPAVRATVPVAVSEPLTTSVPLLTVVAPV